MAVPPPFRPPPRILEADVHIINENISLRTNTKMDNQFCISFRQRKTGGFPVSPNEGMAEPIPIKGYRFVKIAHMQ